MYTPVEVTACSSASQSVRKNSHGSGAWLQLQEHTQRVGVVVSGLVVLTVSSSSEALEKVKKAPAPKCKVKMSDNPPEGTETGDVDTAIFRWC